MAAYSYTSYLTSGNGQAGAGERSVITISPESPLNNMHRAPFWSGPTAARALMAHAETELTSERGPNYFNQLAWEYDRNTTTKKAVDAKLNALRARSAAALTSVDFELTDQQLIIGMRISESQAKLGEKIIESLAKAGRPPEDSIEYIDMLTRKMMQMAVNDVAAAQLAADKTEAFRRAQESGVPMAQKEQDRWKAVPDHVPDAWKQEAQGLLMKAMGDSGMLDAEKVEIASDYVYLVYEMETLIPRRQLRDDILVDLDDGMTKGQQEQVEILSNQLYDKAEADFETQKLNLATGAIKDAAKALGIFQEELVEEAGGNLGRLADSLQLVSQAEEMTAEAREKVLATAGFLRDLDALEFNPMTDAEKAEGLYVTEAFEQRALNILFGNMSKDKMEEQATTRELDPVERTSLGVSIIASFPPTVRLPDRTIQRNYFDVRMQTVEEAQVMQTLLEWAGTERRYPGADRVVEFMDSIKAVPMTQPDIERPSIALVVDPEAANVEHAKAIVSALDPEIGVIVVSLDENVAADILSARQETKVARNSAEFNRAFGAWSLNNSDADHALSVDAAKIDAVVAVADQVIVFHDLPDVSTENEVQLTRTLAAQQSEVARGTLELEAARKAIIDARPAELVEDIKRLAAMPADEISDKDAKAWLRSKEGKDHVAARKQSQKSQGISEDAAERSVYMMKLAKGIVLDNRRREAADRAIAAVPAKLFAAEREAQAFLKGVRNPKGQLVKPGAEHAVATTQAKIHKVQADAAADAYRTLSPMQIAAAKAIEMASDTGKLNKTFRVAPMNYAGAAIETSTRKLIDMPAQKSATLATRLLNGVPNSAGNIRRIYRPNRGVQAVLFDGSNIYKNPKGLEAIRERMDAVPMSATILIQNNEKNPVVKQAIAATGNRTQIEAVAWRITDTSKPYLEDGSRVTINERYTKLDLGFVANRAEPGERPTSRQRQWQSSDLRGHAIMIHGGGSMTARTYNAIMEEAARSGHIGPVGPDAISAYYGTLTSRGLKLEPPKFAGQQSGRAIMQETLIDRATEVVIGAQMNDDYRDFHSANMIRAAYETNKLSAVLDGNGVAMEVSTAYDKAKPFSPSIAETNLENIKTALDAQIDSVFGQVTLMRLGLTGSQAALLSTSAELSKIGSEEKPLFSTLNDVFQSVSNGGRNRMIPDAIAEQMSRPNAWQRALAATDATLAAAREGGMSIITSADPAYPDELKRQGSSAPLYQVGNIDWSRSKTTLVAAGTEFPTAAEKRATIDFAETAKAQGVDVVVHLHDRFSAGVIETISEMPRDNQPKLIIVGDGHPYSYATPEAMTALIKASEKGAVYLTSSSIVPQGDVQEEPELATYKQNASEARKLAASISESVVVLKAPNQDQELLIVAKAIQLDKMVAVIGASDIDQRTPALAEFTAGKELVFSARETAQDNGLKATLTAPVVPPGQASGKTVEGQIKEKPAIFKATDDNVRTATKINPAATSIGAAPKVSTEPLRSETPGDYRLQVGNQSYKYYQTPDLVRFSDPGYAGGLRLLAPGKTSIKSDTRPYSIAPSFIPDMTVGMAESHSGITREDIAQQQQRASKSNSTAVDAPIMVTMSWDRPAPNIGDARAARMFLEAAEANKTSAFDFGSNIVNMEAKAAENRMRENERYRTASDASIAISSRIQQEVAEMFREHQDLAEAQGSLTREIVQQGGEGGVNTAMYHYSKLAGGRER